MSSRVEILKISLGEANKQIAELQQREKDLYESYVEQIDVVTMERDRITTQKDNLAQTHEFMIKEFNQDREGYEKEIQELKRKNPPSNTRGYAAGIKKLQTEKDLLEQRLNGNIEDLRGDLELAMQKVGVLEKHVVGLEHQYMTMTGERPLPRPYRFTSV